MKPVLIVEGKAHEVGSIDYFEGQVHRAMISDGETWVTYYNEKNALEYVENPLKVNMDECLKWVGQYDEVFESIGKLIEHNQKEIQDLATQIADDSEEKPFVVNEKIQLRKEFKLRTYGLMDAQDVVQIFMQDDVDLSGGEEIAVK